MMLLGRRVVIVSNNFVRFLLMSFLTFKKGRAGGGQAL